jgi:alpha-ketoglutarate-dependent taurine dioxygenase
VLFRGFEIRDARDFSEFASAISSTGPLSYEERSSPRSEVDDLVYTSTDHPADQHIVLHNEQSYTLRWPTKIMFYCHTAAQRGGRTPIADSRKILGRLSSATIAAFEHKQILYTRTYNTGLGLRWQTAFQTEDRSVVEAFCRRAAIEWQWLTSDMLRTRQVRAAVRRHPVTNERTWFNHALFFHVTSLAPELSRAIIAALPEEHYPTCTYFGDGQPFSDDVLAELRAAYAAETCVFDWRDGDVLLLDNMLTAHGREPFVGPRRVMTVMADDISVPASSREPICGPQGARRE